MAERIASELAEAISLIEWEFLAEFLIRYEKEKYVL